MNGTLNKQILEMVQITVVNNDNFNAFIKWKIAINLLNILCNKSFDFLKDLHIVNAQ